MDRGRCFLFTQNYTSDKRPARDNRRGKVEERLASYIFLLIKSTLSFRLSSSRFYGCVTRISSSSSSSSDTRKCIKENCKTPGSTTTGEAVKQTFSHAEYLSYLSSTQFILFLRIPQSPSASPSRSHSALLALVYSFFFVSVFDCSHRVQMINTIDRKFYETISLILKWTETPHSGADICDRTKRFAHWHLPLNSEDTKRKPTISSYIMQSGAFVHSLVCVRHVSSTQHSMRMRRRWVCSCECVAKRESFVLLFLLSRELCPCHIYNGHGSGSGRRRKRRIHM